MTHPLTDSDCRQIQHDIENYRSYRDLIRAGYDQAIKDVRRHWLDLIAVVENDAALVVRFDAQLHDMYSKQKKDNDD